MGADFLRLGRGLEARCSTGAETPAAGKSALPANASTVAVENTMPAISRQIRTARKR
jgi:hypothetical protein